MKYTIDIFFFALFVTFTRMPIDCFRLSSENVNNVMPEFSAPLGNVTAIQGRDVQFNCIVKNLGDHQVAWIRSDTKAILSINTRMVANSERYMVTFNDYNIWTLNIYSLRKNDSGPYMCQINTDPMMSQVTYLHINTPPDILNDAIIPSGDYDVMEGGTITLNCKAIGNPEPKVSWKREDGKPIVIRSEKKLVEVIQGENLTLSGINRNDMGPYLCLAQSSIPPIISKRYTVRVHFKPTAHAIDQFIYSPIGGDVELSCTVETSPRTTFQWVKKEGESLIYHPRMNISETKTGPFETRMNLNINFLEKEDFGEYKCITQNSIGRAEAKIYIFENIDGPEISTLKMRHHGKHHSVKMNYPSQLLDDTDLTDSTDQDIMNLEIGTEISTTVQNAENNSGTLPEYRGYLFYFVTRAIVFIYRVIL